VRDFPPFWKDFRQKRIHNMSKEVLGVEAPPSDTVSTT
jgi:hypothetical protein